MNKYLNIIAGVIIGFCAVVHAGVLFEDPFNTADNWVKLLGSPTTSCSGGMFHVDAGAASAIFIHSQNFVDDFTYSVKLKITSTTGDPVGIIFCWQQSNSGYVFYITGSKQYTLGKFVSGKFEAIKHGLHSFSTNTDNIIKICKKSGEITLSCNGALFEKIANSDYTGGSIGLFMNANVKVSFDHALVTDEYEDIKPVTYFKDEFGDNDINGWGVITGSAGIASGGGVLKISNVTSGRLVLFTSGEYKNEPCTTVVTYKGGDPNKIYGITYYVMAIGANIPTYYFVINASRQFAVITGGSYTLTPHSAIYGTTDTLIVTKEYDFMVNGTVIGSAPDQGLVFNATGISADSSLSLEFDNFIAGTNIIVPIVYNPNINPSSKIQKNYILGGLGLIYDIRGRQVASFAEGEYKEKVKNLSSGPYYVIMKGKKDHIIRRAIVKIK
jgi:hypothetical protein